MKKLEKFIKENSLQFEGTGSGLNSDCCIISGYADFIGVKDSGPIIKAVKTVYPTRRGFESELERVYKFAYTFNYGNFWKSDRAAKMYKF